MLAKMHKKGQSPNGKFGFHINNTIGATPQPNSWEADWADFWDQHRLGHMLKLTGDAGFAADKIEKLRQKTRELLSHKPEACIVHGDLWVRFLGRTRLVHQFTVFTYEMFVPGWE